MRESEVKRLASGIVKRRFAITAVLLAIAIVPAGCGDDQSNRTETDVATIPVNLEDGGFAKSTPGELTAPADALLILEVRSGRRGPFRLGVRSPSTAQTFRLPENSVKKLSLNSMPKGQTATLYSGDKEVSLTAR